MFAKHGFQNLLERAGLKRFGLGRFTAQNSLDSHSVPERLRMSFEELGPTFVKLGQLLATRPDLIPVEFSEEFRKLQTQVPAVSFERIEEVLTSHFGKDLNQVFQTIDRNPLGAASIAQVYKAVLKDGSRVVIKVQRPGIEAIIREDLNVLYTLADLMHRYLPEYRVYNPQGIVEEFSRALAQETNFVVEANNIRRFHENFSDDPDIKIPKVYNEYTGRRVLVMEELVGIPLSRQSNLEQAGLKPEVLLKRGLRGYLKMVFTDGLFHGDLHAGNLFILPENKIGLIDFGMVGRLNRKTQTAIAGMLVALVEEDYDRFAYLYLDLAPFNDEVDGDAFARDLRDLIAPYFGLTMKHVNAGKLLMDSTNLAAGYGLILPSDLVLFFKSVVTLEGMGRILVPDFNFLTSALEFAGELVKSHHEPAKVARDMAAVARDMNSFVAALPRQLKQILRRWNSPDSAIRVSIPESETFRRTIEKSASLIFFGLIVSSLILGAAIIMTTHHERVILNMPVASAIGFGLALLLGAFAFSTRR